MKFGTFFKENIRISFSSIVSNKLRAILTMTIIAIGIMSLVGIVTAIEAMKSSIVESFSSLGANSFSITNRWMAQGNRTSRARNNNYISYDEASEFKKRFDVPASTSLLIRLGSYAVKYMSLKSDPNVRLHGIDENGMRNMILDLSQGRNFSAAEVDNGRSVAIIGSDVAKVLFPVESPLEKQISIAGAQFRVIGVITPKGRGIGGGRNEDLQVLIPIETARAVFSLAQPNTEISVIPDNPNMLDVAAGEAEGLFRAIRKLSPSDDTDFEINRSDSFENMMMENIAMVTLAASLIGIITLLGAAVGLMNIMLVSVSERTREIGTRMAIGAKPRMIREQFLFESIIISQMGGVCGIVLGIVSGNMITIFTGGSFVVPWMWILIGVVICLVVGVCSGYLPARKAAGLDPVEALRYE